jgi:flagellar biosynthesis protein FlhB
MFAFKTLAAKYSGALALILAIFSAGLVVVHACHTEKPSHSSASAHHEESAASEGQIIGSESLVAKVCAVTFFLVLLAGRKYFVKIIIRVDSLVNRQLMRLINFVYRPPNIKNSLSLSQLGVIRI